MPKLLQQVSCRPCQSRRQQGDNILWRPNGARVIPRQVEVARVGPEPEADLIHRHQPTGPVNDGPALTQGVTGLGLEATGPRLQFPRLHDLKPGHPSDQAGETCTQDEEHDPQATGRHLGDGNNAGARPLAP